MLRNFIVKPLLSLLAFSAFITCSPGVFGSPPADSAYLDGGDNRVGLILCHGRGKYPTWKVVDPLRKGIHKQLGYHTLSIQMPNEDKNWKEYAEDFPDAHARIADALSFLEKEKKLEKVYLMGHSMGARMASAYMSENPDSGISGLIVAGCRNNGGKPLDCSNNLQDLRLPVLDIWGGNNGKDNRAATERKNLQSNTYIQVEIAGANHKFDGYESEFVAAVADWLAKQ